MRRYRLVDWLLWNGLGWAGCARWSRLMWRRRG